MSGGARRFDLVEPQLNWIRIDHLTTLKFGEAELGIEAPFTLEIDGQEYDLDPALRSGLGPLLTLYPDNTGLAMEPGDTLRVTFVSGARLTVPPSPQFEAWNIGGFWCPPGGFHVDPPAP